MRFLCFHANRPSQLFSALPDVFQMQHTILLSILHGYDCTINGIIAQIQACHINFIVTIFCVGADARCYIAQVHFCFLRNGCRQRTVCIQFFVSLRFVLVFVYSKGIKQAAQCAGSLTAFFVCQQTVIQILFNGNFYALNTQNLTTAVFICFGSISACLLCPFFSCCRSHCIICIFCTHTSIACQIRCIGNCAVCGVGLIAQFAIVVICIRNIHCTIHILSRSSFNGKGVILIARCINSNIPFACTAFITSRQLATQALCQTQLNAHRLVHPVICCKLCTIGSQNRILIAIVIPANSIHMCTQIAIIAVNINPQKIAIS